jgi:hypothetical protein
MGSRAKIPITCQKRGEKLKEGGRRIHKVPLPNAVPTPAPGVFFPQQRQGLLVGKKLRVPQEIGACLKAIEFIIPEAHMPLKHIDLLYVTT